jgi:hypothetical protein
MNTNNARKTFTNLSEPQQIRELNRQMEWIWHQLLGGLTERAFSTAGARRLVTKTESMIADDLQAESMTVDRLSTALFETMVAIIPVATIDFATVTDLVSEALVIDHATGNDVYIKNLTITSANLLNAVITHLVVMGEDHNYYSISVGSDGSVSAVDITEDVSQEEIAAGVMADGRYIFNADDINVENMNASTVKASEGDFVSILAGALEAGSITAGEAVIASASIPLLYTTSIRALGTSLDISANDSIKLLADNMNRLVRLDAEGLHVGDSQTSNEVLIDSESVNVVMYGNRYSKFAADYVQFGNYQLRKSVDGGLVFKKA